MSATRPSSVKSPARKTPRTRSSTATTSVTQASRRQQHTGASGESASAKKRAQSGTPENGVIDTINTQYLETLMGYNARRAALSIISVFLDRMAVYDLKPVEFSVLSLVLHNPGITSRQLCAALNILPPNLVGLVQSLDKRGLIARMPHPHDGRAMGLHPTREGAALMTKAEKTASELELDVTQRLTASERDTLLRLLQKIYL